MPLKLESIFGVPKPVIGMLHAPPLAGSPRYAGNWPGIVRSVLDDAAALADGGVHGFLLENFGDAPFWPGTVEPATIAQLTALACELRRSLDLPLGINVLRNDSRAALAIALAAGARFIRVNVLCGARVTDQGLIQATAHELLRDRTRLCAGQVAIFADVDVKHSAPLAVRPVADEVHDLVERAGADALIVSGRATGQAVDLDQLREVRSAAGETPVLVGSGATAQTAASLLGLANGLIVGSSLKVDGLASNPVDPNRVRELMQSIAS